MAAQSDARPVIFAYDGSELAAFAIDEAARLLATPRPALVVTIWQPFDLGFVPVRGVSVDAADIEHVRHAAEGTAGEGAERADRAGFHAHALALEGAPTWKALVGLAQEHEADLVVLGSHGRTGLSGVLLGSVAASVASHWQRSVLIVHRDS